MCVDRLLRLAVLILLGLGAMAASVNMVDPAIASGNPCEYVTGDPDPPIGPPEIEVGGVVIDSGSNNPIEDATIKLYTCAGTTSMQVDSQLTDSSGRYAFTDVSVEQWYYVEAVMTGPLSGMTPSSGTDNPSVLVAISDSPTVVNFAFE